MDSIEEIEVDVEARRRAKLEPSKLLRPSQVHMQIYPPPEPKRGGKHKLRPKLNNGGFQFRVFQGNWRSGKDADPTIETRLNSSLAHEVVHEVELKHGFQLLDKAAQHR